MTQTTVNASPAALFKDPLLPVGPAKILRFDFTAAEFAANKADYLEITVDGVRKVIVSLK